DQNVRIINLSLSGPRDNLLARLLDVALAKGIAVVAAVDPKIADGGFPASYPGVLAVAAEQDERHPSNVLLAPGSDIPTSTPHHAWTFVSGSSYAAAHVTGAFALLLEKAPHKSALQLRDALAPSNVAGIAHGNGRTVDACAAVAQTTGVCACS